MNLEDYKNKWFQFVDYKPHAGQLKMHYPPNGDYDYNNNPEGARFTVACCGRRWGKSFSSAREAQILLTQPNKRVWVVAPNYGTSEKIFRIIYEDMVIKQNLATVRKSSKEQYIEFEWGSSVYGKSADHPDSLIGEGLDLVILDEASKINPKIWESYIRPTLSDRKGRAIFVSTPSGYNYFYDLYLRGKDKKNWYSFNSPSWENNHAFPKGQLDDDIIEAKDSVSSEIFYQEYGAKFTSLSGRVYKFDEDLDVGNADYNPYLPTFCSIDFGYRMPAVLWFQTYEKNQQYHVNIIDEFIHHTNVKTDDLIQNIISKPYNVRRYYGDPAGFQAQSFSGMGDAEIFYKRTGHRVHTIRDKVSRNISSGISHVRDFLNSATGMRRIHVNPKCTGIIEDFLGYRYPEWKDGRPLHDDPLKDGRCDHGMDALRYFFVNRFPIKQFKIRKLTA